MNSVSYRHVIRDVIHRIGKNSVVIQRNDTAGQDRFPIVWTRLVPARPFRRTVNTERHLKSETTCFRDDAIEFSNAILMPQQLSICILCPNTRDNDIPIAFFGFLESRSEIINRLPRYPHLYALRIGLRGFLHQDTRPISLARLSKSRRVNTVKTNPAF